MIGNFIRVALRNFYKRKFFFLINLLGISIGFASYIILYLFTATEEQHDQFHANKDLIYRVKASRYHKNVLSREMVDVNLAAGPDAWESFPEVDRYVQLVKVTSVVKYKDEWFKTEKSAYSSADFFKIFSFPLLQGNDSLVLSRPFTAAISQSFAKKIFKDEDPVGKTINYKGRFDYEITGVFADMPLNSHMDFDLLLSFESYKKIVRKSILNEPWRWDGFVTYLMVKAGANASDLEEKFPKLIEEKTGEWLRNTDQQLKLTLQPLTSIYLHSNFNGELKSNGDAKLVLYLRLIAGSILLLAWINYISLSTAKSLERAREVGVRKVLGSDQRQLMGQFLAESFLINILALLVSSVWIATAGQYWPAYGIRFDQFQLLSVPQWVWLIVVLFGGSLLSGLYPAVVLSGFNPAKVLKGTSTGTANGINVRRFLVSLQYVCSLVLVMWIYTAGKQIQHLRNQPLGFDSSSRLIIRDSEVYDSSYTRGVEKFKQEVVRLANVEGMTYIETLPGENIRVYANGVRRMKADTSDVNSFSYVRVDNHFADVLQLKVIAGKFFTETSRKQKEVVINQSAAKRLGFTNFEDAIQEEIYFRDDTVRIIGVLRDFYFHSPKSELKPLIFQYDPRQGNHYIVSVSNQNMKDVIAEAGKLFGKIFPGQPFHYQFLDQYFEQQYQADQNFEDALFFFSGLSIWITSLGLMGMAAYSTTIRRKEISIRKVLGSTSLQVLLLFWLDYFKMVLISAILAIPAAWYIADSWLMGFSLRIELSPWLFTAPILILIISTVLAVAVQTIKAAWANPVDGMRYE